MSILISRLKEVDLGGCCLSDEDGEYLEHHVVSDIPTDFSAVKIIFLMESPHETEVEKKFPLAGPSGVTVTEDLIMNCASIKNGLRHEDDPKTPVGGLVKGCKISSLSIVNVSSLPLQKEAYGDGRENSDEIHVLWCAFKEIKAEFEKKMTAGEPDLCPVASRVYEVIENDLICRIERIVGLCQSPPSIITFGNVARRSILRAKKQAKGEPLTKLDVCEQFPPHPSSQFASPSSLFAAHRPQPQGRTDLWNKWKLDNFRRDANRSDLVKYINGRIAS